MVYLRPNWIAFNVEKKTGKEINYLYGFTKKLPVENDGRFEFDDEVRDRYRIL